MIIRPNPRKIKSIPDSLKHFRVETDAAEERIKVSPYVYHTDMKYRIVKKRDCSRLMTHQLIRSGGFTQLSYDILGILNDYDYLNAYLLRQRLSHITDKDPIKKEIMREQLKKMVNYGLVIQYELVHTDSAGKEQGSPFIYGLSPSGTRFLTEQRGWRKGKTKIPAFSCENALRILAENQFSIVLENQYDKTDTLTYCDFSHYVYESCGVRMLYGIKLPEEGELALFAFAARNTPDWNTLLLTQLRNLLSYMKENNNLMASILIIVETEWLAMQCEKLRCCENDLKHLDVFYATDTSFLMEDHVFDRLIEVNPQKDYSSRTIFRLSI